MSTASIFLLLSLLTSACQPITAPAEIATLAQTEIAAAGTDSHAGTPNRPLPCRSRPRHDPHARPV